MSQDDPRFSPVIALLAVSAMWEGQLSSILRDIGITTRKFGLLGHIYAEPGISFSELARRSYRSATMAAIAAWVSAAKFRASIEQARALSSPVIESFGNPFPRHQNRPSPPDGTSPPLRKGPPGPPPHGGRKRRRRY